MIEQVDHVNVVVDDLATMTAFYRDVLGLRLAKQVSIRGPWIEAVTGLTPAEADVALFAAGAGAGVELIQYRVPEGPRPDLLGHPQTKGIRHIAFRVQAMDAAVRRLTEAGVEFLSSVQAVPTDQVDFVGRTKRIVYCRDPEGNLLELAAYESSGQA